jgi:hypothetical protein
MITIREKKLIAEKDSQTQQDGNSGTETDEM